MLFFGICGVGYNASASIGNPGCTHYWCAGGESLSIQNPLSSVIHPQPLGAASSCSEENASVPLAAIAYAVVGDAGTIYKSQRHQLLRLTTAAAPWASLHV